MNTVFLTSDGRKIRGKQLKKAFDVVANFWVANAYALRRADRYASHVTDANKDAYLQRQLDQAERIRKGTELMGFWLWQRINQEITGKCVALLSK